MKKIEKRDFKFLIYMFLHTLKLSNSIYYFYNFLKSNGNIKRLKEKWSDFKKCTKC